MGSFFYAFASILVFMYGIHVISGALDSSCKRTRIVTRKEWRAMDSEAFRAMDSASHIFIHNYVEAECKDQISCMEKMRKIQIYDMKKRGWDDIIFNFFIGGDGLVYEGRGWHVTTATLGEYNTMSISIGFMGSFLLEPPSQAMLKTAKDLINCGKEMNYISKISHLHGHADVSCTPCPGYIILGIIQQWPGYQQGPLPGFLCRT